MAAARIVKGNLKTLPLATLAERRLAHEFLCASVEGHLTVLNSSISTQIGIPKGRMEHHGKL